MGNFVIIDFKKVKKFLIVLIGIVLSVGVGNIFFEDRILEVSNSNRLLPIYSVETDAKQVALTFDCAWGADDIEEIVSILSNNEVSATFFMVGDWIEKYSDAVKILNDNNMELGNHSNSHAHVNNLSYEKNVEDMKACNEKIKDLTGNEVKFYRGPYGEYNNTVIQAAESLDMKVIQWDIDTL